MNSKKKKNVDKPQKSTTNCQDHFLTKKLQSLATRWNPFADVWIHKHTRHRERVDIAQDVALYHVREESCRRFFFFFALVLTPRGYKEEKKAGNGGLGGWKMPGSHSTTASNLFLTPQHRRGGDERKQRAYTHTHTHTVCAASIQRHQGPWRDARNGNWVAAQRLITEFQGDGSGKDGSCVVTTR